MPRRLDDLPDQGLYHPSEELDPGVDTAEAEATQLARLQCDQQTPSEEGNVEMEPRDNFIEWCKQLDLTEIVDRPDVGGVELTIGMRSQEFIPLQQGDATLNKVRQEAEDGESRYTRDGEILRRTTNNEFGQPVH